MRLQAYLSEKGVTQQAFADQLNHIINRLRAARGLPEDSNVRQQHVQSYCVGRTRPTDEDRVAAIFEATGGQVTPNDFYDLPPEPAVQDAAGAAE